MSSAAGVLFLASGTSQAMQSAYIEDLISLVPAAAFLLASRIERWPPSQRFPFGYHRAVSVAYLVGAVATLLLGVFLLIDNGIVLIRGHRSEIGTAIVFGQPISMVWLMLAAILYSTIPAMILGRLKLPLAHAIHDKVLIADADMQKADWMTGIAAVVGVLGIAAGVWWLDGAAAVAIAFAIVHDGVTHVWRAVKDLADERPTTIVGHEPDPIVDRVAKAVRAIDWVDKVEVHFREEGRLVTGAIRIVPRQVSSDVIRRIPEVVEAARQADWRVYAPDVVLLPPERADEVSPGQRRSAAK